MKSPLVPVIALELLLISLFAVSTFAFPGNDLPPYTSRLWQTDAGLPQDDVRAICQMSDGYLCLGTSQGLARFDGIHFTPFALPFDSETKNHARTLLCLGSDGTLWSATEDGKLRLWKNEQMTELSLPASVTNISCTAIFPGRDGSLWIGTEFNGLFHFKDGKFQRWNVKTGLAHRSVRSICEDNQGTIWVATAAGLNALHGEKITTLTTQNGLPHNSIRVVYADKKGGVWIASNFGLTHWKDGIARNFTKNDGLSDNLISAIFEDHLGTIWIGTLNGLNRFVNGKWHTEQRSDGTSYDRVNCIFEDRESNLWIGSRDGLSELRQRTIASLTQQQGLTHNTVTFVFQDHTTNLWVGFWGGGVNKIENGRITAFTTREGLSSDLVLTMHQSRNGDLWFGMDYDGGLTLLRGGKFIHYGIKNGLKDQGIKVLQDDGRANLWIGTRTALLRFYNEKFTRFTTSDGLPSNTIEAIHEDGEGRLWFGTTGGLALWNNGKFKTFTTADGLSHNSVTSIYQDQAGALWLGTRGGGLNRLGIAEPKTDEKTSFSFTSFTTDTGLFNDQIFAVVEDDFHFLWMTSPQGIFRVNKKELEDFVSKKNKSITCVPFGKAEGMPSVQCKGSDKTAACKTPEGQLWFATAKGLAIVDPKNVKFNELPPPVVIEEVLADKRQIEDGRSRIENGKTFTQLSPSSMSHSPTSLQIPPGRGELEIHYTALSYTAPEKNRFKYKLEAVDSDWVDAKTRRVAYYNNINPGSYVFRVRACNSDGIWNEKGPTLTFLLQPHFWQTWWFKVSLAGGIILIAAGLYHLRIARFREIERLRLRIAADLHDEVGSNVGSISVLSEMLKDFGEMGEEEKKDVAKINQLSMQTAGSIREIVWFINPEYDTLHELLLRMKDVADNLLGGMTYRLETPRENLSRKLPLEFRQNFFLIYKETLANVMKHSKASCVEIKVSENHDEWRLEVRDNGLGFNPNLASRGNGLKNLRRRADKLKGRLEIKSSSGEGTSVVFSVTLAS